MEIILNITIGVLLLFSAIQDLIYKRIWLWLIMTGCLLIGVCLSFINTLPFYDRLGGAAVGLAVIMISILTKGKIGMADGLLLCTTGIGLGFWRNLELFAIALLMAAVISILLLMLRKADKKKAIPFVPFLFASYLIIISNSTMLN